ncbi:ADP-ribosylation factor-like 6 interacting protein 1 isoform X2 [Oratosquilla oratoria]|uniref:ADP-ribosylation factor-like 6 interacting protein 1 isoform X2 n=1 Tax=Oratosquilla oratoria TaxID=337810 RepID=UPI003F75B430
MLQVNLIRFSVKCIIDQIIDELSEKEGFPRTNNGFIWYVEPSMLTLFSILGIIITLADFLVPQVVPWVCGAHFWTGAHERRYEEIIKAIANIFGIYTCITTTLTTMKTNKPRTYFVSVTGMLILCAWIGNTVNNLLLTYIIVLAVVLFPGLKATGILHKYFASTISTVAGFIKGQLGASEDPTQSKKKD